ncbi:unnamed protein product [Thelazia callipaeda]|uniref:Kinase n=1 Tax=Thelazia callipaeda TaxID=103827 RepID=A0A0N5CZ17_THECL|nr:unnamed protein product [Thelazia callipaeda]
MVDEGCSVTALPLSYEWYQEQIAGHHLSIVKNGKHQIGLIKQVGSETLLKPIQEGVRGVCEVCLLFFESKIKLHILKNIITVAFYNKLKQQNHENVTILKLKSFIPKFYGLKSIQIGKKKVECIILEDLTYCYKYPCIMDIKVGKVTYDPCATKAKRLSEIIKYPEQESLGFRLTGYRMRIDDNINNLRIRDKKWGKSRTLENIVEAFAEFLSARVEEKMIVAEETLRQLYDLQKWFRSQRVFHFYASSILLIYESSLERDSNVLVKLIDFSHVFSANGVVDENYLFGLDNMVSIIEKYRDTIDSKSY